MLAEVQYSLVELYRQLRLGLWSRAMEAKLDLGHEVSEHAVTRKLNMHILTKFFLMTIMCYLDRTNLAFAALQLNKSLGFSEHVYGVGSSVFFIGYAICQVPSNWVLVKLGAPFWLSILIVSWGVVATMFAGLNSIPQFYALRLLLGVAESGTFPGMWYHLSTFYAEADIGLAYSYVSVGTAISQVIGAPLAASLLALDGFCGLAGWQWLFLVEGFPTILLGIWINRSLAHSPSTAPFLTPAEKTWLLARHESQKSSRAGMPGVEVRPMGAFRSFKTWWLALVAAMEATVKLAIIYWAPLIIASMVGHPVTHQARRLLATPDLSTTALPVNQSPEAQEFGYAGIEETSEALVALLTSLPFGAAAAWMLLTARHSKKTGEVRLHATIPFVISTFALASLAYYIDTSPPLAFLSLLAATSIWGSNGILYSYPAAFLQGPAAATGIALINTIGSLGGVIGPMLLGTIKHSQGTYANAVWFLALLSFLLIFLVYTFPDPGRPTSARGRMSRPSARDHGLASSLASSKQPLLSQITP
ncbi:hypothetical protein WJX74_000209 [Apatococcus lobatus]|uniref:Major facilitator superfamily (MFS) profile domain-containing protein n=2 Tax=Apatococcus TaxID=904362 RepID=A0AAW1RV24_9CHLO